MVFSLKTYNSDQIFILQLFTMPIFVNDNTDLDNLKVKQLSCSVDSLLQQCSSSAIKLSSNQICCDLTRRAFWG